MISGNKNISIFDQKLSLKLFKRLSLLIMQKSGIKMPESKRIMLQARLLKRLKALGMNSFEEYCEFLFSDEGQRDEFVNMIDVVTTNKTDFFREPEHFNYLINSLLPSFVSSSFNNEFTIWSSACSTGEEPYTLSIVLKIFNERYNNFDYKVLATDLSTSALDIAKSAVYSFEKVETVPLEIKRKYFLRSKNKTSNLVKITPIIRNKVTFGRLNLLESEYNIPKEIDVIFCRNVFIYFEKDIQEAIINKFYNYLTPNGFLFMGHSESLNGLDVRFELVAPTIYRKIK